MCGISAIISFDRKPKLSDLKAMLEQLKHRGPDGSGLWNDKQVALGMTRLSIIDIKGGKQPLYNEDKNIVIVGNGEIYNYRILDKELRKKGHKPRTKSDIETIIHIYEEYGEKGVNKLIGMFAFVLYDIKKQIIIVGRDRFGEKPIYYSINNEQIYISSEMKSLIRVIPQDEVDMDAINLYFHYYYVPEPLTMFKNISKVQAGQYFKIDLKSKKIEKKIYWNPSVLKIKKYTNLLTKLQEKINNAVESTLVSDVDIGFSLSGGIDSTAILAIAADKIQKKIKAFTIGYEGTPVTDERRLASIVTKQYKVTHIQKELKNLEVVQHFPELVYDGDDPIADIAGHGIYSVSRLAHENNIKVLICGLGGDELFWGYPWVRDITKLNENNNDFTFYNTNTSYNNAISFISKLQTDYFKSSINRLLPKQIFYNKPKGMISNARLSQELIRKVWLVSNCLSYCDRLSMASSVELRSPLLNHLLAELAYTDEEIIMSYRKDGKHWLKKAVAQLLPKEILTNKKQGFTPPIRKWLFGIISEYIPLLQKGFLVKNNIISKWKIYTISKLWLIIPFYWYSIYQLLVLEIWCREYVIGETATHIKHKYI